ncbi:MAG: hypothetical protein JJU11_06110 [Candidatus Sumerlaeia bacterium]|nr:hypothetical protein [Candidatus Sumerlaeia bacterium]
MTASIYQRLFLLALMILGAVAFAVILDWGRFEPTHMDWAKENGAYRILAQAIDEGRLPYHSSIRLQGTQRFLAIPEYVWFPTIGVLKFADFSTFALIHVLVLYIIGQIGLVFLARLLKLHWLAFAMVILIFNMNGHIVAHLFEGHLMWAGYFFLSWLIYTVVGFLESRERSRWVPGIALVLFLMLLQGAFHLWTISLLFLIILFMTRRRYWLDGLVFLVMTFALCLCRLLPAAVTFGGSTNPFLLGFPNVSTFLEGLVIPNDFTRDAHMLEEQGFPIMWWEFTHYIGMLPFLFICYFGIWQRYIASRWNRSFRELDLPILVVTLFSFWSLYKIITMMPIPILNSQRLPSRFFVMPLLFLAVLSALEFNRSNAARLQSRGMMLVWLGLVVLSAVDLFRHAMMWRVPLGMEHFPVKWYFEEFNASTIIEWDEPRYQLAVHLGFLGTFLSLIGVAAVMYYHRKWEDIQRVPRRLLGGNS